MNIAQPNPSAASAQVPTNPYWGDLIRRPFNVPFKGDHLSGEFDRQEGLSVDTYVRLTPENSFAHPSPITDKTFDICRKYGLEPDFLREAALRCREHFEAGHPDDPKVLTMGDVSLALHAEAEKANQKYLQAVEFHQTNQRAALLGTVAAWGGLALAIGGGGALAIAAGLAISTVGMGALALSEPRANFPDNDVARTLEQYSLAAKDPALQQLDR